MKEDYEYIEATEELLERIWEKNIKSNSDDERWIKWQDGFVKVYPNSCRRCRTVWEMQI